MRWLKGVVWVAALLVMGEAGGELSAGSKEVLGEQVVRGKRGPVPGRLTNGEECPALPEGECPLPTTAPPCPPLIRLMPPAGFQGDCCDPCQRSQHVAPPDACRSCAGAPPVGSAMVTGPNAHTAQAASGVLAGQARQGVARERRAPERVVQEAIRPVPAKVEAGAEAARSVDRYGSVFRTAQRQATVGRSEKWQGTFTPYRARTER